MPKRNQQHPAREASGHNNPKKSTPITTGTYKKQETYHEQAATHENPAKVAQESHVHPTHEHNQGLDHQANSRERMEEGEKRSGSDSNASKHRKSSRVHDHDKEQKQPQKHAEPGYDFTRDLEPDSFAGENHGLRDPSIVDYNHSAEESKALHARLADLTDDELKNVVLVTPGSRLEQGAKYIDLNNLEQGEFVASAGMIAEPGHSYVPKKDTDYVLWNRLNQVDNPTRLDEPSSTDE